MTLTMDVWKLLIGSAGLLLFLIIIAATILLRDFRRLLAMFLVLLAALALTSCATTKEPRREASVFDCAPKGYERIDGWEVRDHRTGLATVTESGEPVQITSVGFSKNGRSLLLVFMGNALILVDRDPDDPNVPLLVNTQYFTDDDKLRAKPQGACGWRELIQGETA